GPRASRTAVLRVAAIQQGPNEADPRTNVERLLRAIDEAAAGGANVVLPTELSTTPYFCGAPAPAYREWAEPVPGLVTAAVGERARRHELVVVLPLFVRGDLHRRAADARVREPALRRRLQPRRRRGSRRPPDDVHRQELHPRSRRCGSRRGSHRRTGHPPRHARPRGGRADARPPTAAARPATRDVHPPAA